MKQHLASHSPSLGPCRGGDTPCYPRMLKPLSASSERVLPNHVIGNHTGTRVDAPLLNRGFLDQGFSDPDGLSLQFVASSCAAADMSLNLLCLAVERGYILMLCVCMCIRVTDIIITVLLYNLSKNQIQMGC